MIFTSVKETFIGFPNEKLNSFSFGNKVSAFILLLLLLSLLYHNTLDAIWHLDDYPNIVVNAKLHIDDLSFQSISQTFYSLNDGSKKDRLYRPVSCLTFAFNWYLGKNEVVGYHIVNITIHFLISFILFQTILMLYRTPRLHNKNKAEAYFIALLTSVFWAINPIQIQAVTYIVQRMAVLAAMFSIMAMYLYIRARISRSINTIFFSLLGCAICLLLAIGSKENAILLPLNWLLIEVIFIRNISIKNNRRKFIIFVFGISAALFMSGLFLFTMMKIEILSLFKGYDSFFFTPFERLITQPRILFLYLSQIFYPMPNRLSIVHDIITSKTLTMPWTTLPAIIGIIFLVTASICVIRRFPLFSLGVLFFFLNHIIESSIIPLEMVFEHRNYLPSFFIFLPIASGIYKMLKHYCIHNRIMYLTLVTFITCLITGFGVANYLRNFDWKTHKSLWLDALQKAPNNSRPYHNLAVRYYEKIGDYDTALGLYNQALSKTYNKRGNRYKTLKNIGNCYCKKGEYEKGISIYKILIKSHPQKLYIRYSLAAALIQTGEMQEALVNINLLISKNSQSSDYYNLKGVALLHLQRYELALLAFKQFYQMRSKDWRGPTGIGISLYGMNKFKEAIHHFFRAKQLAPQNIDLYLYLIEIYFRTNDTKAFKEETDKILSLFTLDNILKALDSNNKNKIAFPSVSNTSIVPILKKEINKKFEINLN